MDEIIYKLHLAKSLVLHCDMATQTTFLHHIVSLKIPENDI